MKQRVQILLAAAIFSFGVTRVTAQATADIVGTISSEVSVDNRGQANISIPLSVGPGRAGLAPKLTLGYSSGAGNGVVGQGFSLSTGYPQSITRGRTILARDGILRGVNFNSADKFYLDGKRLICVSGTPGEANSVYRTEVDSFASIVALGTGTQIDSFVAVQKDGSKYTFGKLNATVDAYHVYMKGPLNVPATATESYAWALKRVEDAGGNSMLFEYEGTTDGEYVLKKISYAEVPGGGSARYRVSLVYNSELVSASLARLDRSSTFVSARHTLLTKRLDQIDVEVNETTWKTLAQHKLGYEYAPRNGPLRLKWVQSKLATPATEVLKTARPITISWLDDSIETGTVVARSDIPSAQTIAQNDLRWQTFADFNGDGKTDFVKGLKPISVSLSNGASFSAATSWHATAEPFEGKLIEGDFDGDGKRDVLFGDNLFYNLYALRSTGSSFVGLNGAAAPTFVADTTLIFNDPVMVGGATTQLTREGERESLASRIIVADFTGDGRDDILLHAYNGHVYLIKSLGNGFSSPTKSTFKGIGWEEASLYNWHLEFVGNLPPPATFSMQPMPLDLNGDGLTDYLSVVTIRGYIGENKIQYTLNRVVQAWINQGDGVFATPYDVDSQFVSSALGAFDWIGMQYGVMPTDVNNDGLMDLFIFGDGKIDGQGASTTPAKHDRRRWTLYLNRGSTSALGAPVFDTYPGAIPNTITAGGESINTFFASFINADSYLLNPTLSQGDTNYGRLRSSIESSGSSVGRFQDMNGDGFADYVWYVYSKPPTPSNPNTSYMEAAIANRGWWVMYSNRGVRDASDAFFSSPQKITNTARGTTTLWERATQVPYASNANLHFTESPIVASFDLNGDGRPDPIVYNSSNGEQQLLVGVVSNQTPYANIVSSVSDGLGRTYEIKYKAAKDDSLYTEGASVSYPVVDIKGSNPVVAELWKDSGTTGYAKYSYQYSGNRMDLSGRGSLGFHSFVTIDQQTKIFKYQFLVQSFPMTGLTHREQTFRYWEDAGDVKFRYINSHDNTVVFDEVSSGSGGYGTVFPFISQAVESRWENSDTEAHLTYARGTGAESKAETLFTASRPTDPHISISATSLFDDQTSVPTSLPEPFQLSDTTSEGVNTVVGVTSFGSYLGDQLPREITYGNLKELSTDYGDGYSETVKTTYESASSVSVGTATVPTLFGLPKSIATTASAPDYENETAPTKRFTYVANTPYVASETLDATNNDLDLKTKYTRDESKPWRVTTT